MTTVTQDTSTARDKMLQRVLNLRARAEDEGSSEAEMNTAFTMAMKLMDSYGIQEAELAIAEAEGRIELEIVQKVCDTSLLKGVKKKHKVSATLSAIEVFTETKIVMMGSTIEFTGHRPDTELANYLVALIRNALDSEYANYKRNIGGRTGYGAQNSFQTAMAIRISRRLRQMADDRNAEREQNRKDAEKLKIEDRATGSSTALVIAEIAEQKEREVNDTFTKAYPNLRTTRTTYRSTNATAHGAGAAAGNRLNLGRAINSGSANKRIA